MAHDFKQDVYNNVIKCRKACGGDFTCEQNCGDAYEHRQSPENSDEVCEGLMDYKQLTGGWSACSARDFSRHITGGGKFPPCLNYNSMLCLY